MLYRSSGQPNFAAEAIDYFHEALSQYPGRVENIVRVLRAAAFAEDLRANAAHPDRGERRYDASRRAEEFIASGDAVFALAERGWTFEQIFAASGTPLDAMPGEDAPLDWMISYYQEPACEPDSVADFGDRHTLWDMIQNEGLEGLIRHARRMHEVLAGQVADEDTAPADSAQD